MHVCDLLASTYKPYPLPLWLFLDPHSWNWRYAHEWHSLTAGGRFTGERHLYVGRRVGLSTLAKKFCDPEYPKMSAQSPGMYSPDPVDSSLKGRCVSE